jgi:hypothetical protein
MKTLNESVAEFSAILTLKGLQLLGEPSFGNGAPIDSLGYWSHFGDCWVSRNGCFTTSERLTQILWRRCQALGVDDRRVLAYLAETHSPEADQAFERLSFDEKLSRFRAPVSHSEV